MFCKRCRYNLKTIESRACPECGRAFDPQNRKTYRKRVGLPKWVRRIGQGLVVLFVIALIALGVNEWRYQREVGAAEQLGGVVRWSGDAHQWAEWIPFLHDRLQHVDSLYFGGNQLTMLPPEIGKLMNLEELNLNNNQLTTLPPELWRLAELVWLRLINNQLTTLPPEIGKLTNLKRLWLHYNQLTTLPPEIGKLTKLEGLRLDGNQLTTLPPEIGKLTKLSQLLLGGNPIADVDMEHLKSLENLEHLDLSGTNVTKVGVAALKLVLPNCRIYSDFPELNP